MGQGLRKWQHGVSGVQRVHTDSGLTPVMRLGLLHKRLRAHLGQLLLA